jgi:hypothetical protein
MVKCDTCGAELSMADVPEVGSGERDQYGGLRLICLRCRNETTYKTRR